MKGSIESSMNDAMMVADKAKTSRKRVKPKILRESALDAGLAVLAAMESSDIAPRPVTITAKTMVTEGIEAIMRLRNRNVPLLRIYTDMRKASGIRISFDTFSGYVCEIAKERGLKSEKPMKKTGTQSRPDSAPAPAPAPSAVEASPMDAAPASMTTDAGPAPAVEVAMTETAGMDGWCDRCATEAERMTRDDGRAWWACPACRALWADEDGRITNKRLAVKKAV